MRLRLVLPLLCALAPSLPAQSTGRGVQLFEAHDRAAARAELTAAVRQNGRDARAHHYLGRLALLDGDAEEAVKHLERAIELDGSVSGYQYWYASAVTQQTMRASPLKRPMLAGRMKAAAERAVALDGRNVDARDLLVDFYSMAPGMMGGSDEKAGEQAQAIARLDAMRGHLAAARLAMKAKDSAAVEREMNAAIAAAPDSLRPYSALAIWYTRAERWAPAFATMDRYIARRPDDPYGPNAVGRIAAFSGQQLARGEQGIRAFLAKPPRDAAAPVLSRAHQRLGQVLAHQGKHAEARAAFQQAVALDPHNDEARKAVKP